MQSLFRPLAALALLWATSADVRAAEESTDAAAAARSFVSSLDFRTGQIPISEAHVTLNVDGGYRFLGARDSRRVLEDFWGNPEDTSVLGMIVPDAAPLDSAQSWAVVLTWSGDGHVSDEEASTIDYTELLKDMQEGTRAHNEELAAANYPTVELIGWAQPPRYDASTRKLHWAKELQFGGATAHTLNYDVRVLGREGYLSMNAVADMDSLADVNGAMSRVLEMANFDDGFRYADFNPSSDKVAGYGIAALVGGGLAAKSGLLAKLGILLLKFWKLAVLGVVAIGAGIAKLFGRKSPA